MASSSSSTNNSAAAGNYRRVPLSSSDSISSFSSQPQVVSAADNHNNASSNNNNNTNDDARFRRDSRSVSEKFTDKLWAAAWVAAAALVGWWARVPTTLFTGKILDAPHRFLLQLVAAGVGLNMALAAYLLWFLPAVRKIPPQPDAWQAYCPRVIPAMTLTGVSSFLLLIRATWPAWGFLSPAVLSLEALGLLFALQFVPSW